VTRLLRIWEELGCSFTRHGLLEHLSLSEVEELVEGFFFFSFVEWHLQLSKKLAPFAGRAKNAIRVGMP
jgi:hypothetical protein